MNNDAVVISSMWFVAKPHTTPSSHHLTSRTFVLRRSTAALRHHGAAALSVGFALPVLPPLASVGKKESA